MKLKLLVLLILSVPGFSQSIELDPSGRPISSSNLQPLADNDSFDINSIAALSGLRPLNELNVAGQADSYPWISPDGLRLYYTNGTSITDNRLMFTRRNDASSNFITPVQIPIPSLVEPINFWLTTDELKLYIGTRNGLFYTQRSSVLSSFITPIQITLTGLTATIITGISFDSTLNSLYLKAYPYPGIKKFNRTSSTSFALDYSFDNNFGAGNFMEGQLSKSDLTYTLANGDIYSSSIIQITRDSVNDNFTGDYYTVASGLTGIGNRKLQPTTSQYMGWYVFVVNSTGTWPGNDLYIARNIFLANDEFPDNYFSIYPNPSSGIFNVDYNPNMEMQNATVAIYNSIGQEVRTEKLKQQYDFTGFATGVYLMKIVSGANSIVKKISIE